MENPPAGALTVRFITAAEALPLRAAVLRPGKPVEAAVFPGDEKSDSFHLGAFLTSPGKAGLALLGKPVAVASFFHNAHPELKETAQYQLRGMAADPVCRGRGAGRMLLLFALNLLRKDHIGLLWCNARETAVPFYEKSGFRQHGNPFFIPGIGLHRLMYIFPETTAPPTTG